MSQKFLSLNFDTRQIPVRPFQKNTIKNFLAESQSLYHYKVYRETIRIQLGIKANEELNTRKATGFIMPRQLLLARKSHCKLAPSLVVVLAGMEVDRFFYMQ